VMMAMLAFFGTMRRRRAALAVRPRAARPPVRARPTHEYQLTRCMVVGPGATGSVRTLPRSADGRMCAARRRSPAFSPPGARGECLRAPGTEPRAGTAHAERPQGPAQRSSRSRRSRRRPARHPCPGAPPTAVLRRPHLPCARRRPVWVHVRGRRAVCLAPDLRRGGTPPRRLPLLCVGVPYILGTSPYVPPLPPTHAHTTRIPGGTDRDSGQN